MRTFMNHIRRTLADRKPTVDLLVIFFGVGSWVGVNGLFLQLPLLVETLPEGWNLPSYTSVVVQVGNIGPILYSLVRRHVVYKRSDELFIYSVMGLGCITAFLVSFLYQATTEIGGVERSTAFLTFCFLASLVGCTSAVLFLPYIRHFRDIYLFTYLIGEGLSAFIPSIIALIQGIGGNSECTSNDGTKNNGTNLNPLNYNDARFGTKYYFIIIAIVMTLSLISFYLLNNSTVCQSERVTIDPPSKDIKNMTKSDEEQDQTPSNDAVIQTNVIMKGRYVLLLVLTAAVNGIAYGLLPSIQSYSCLPYGNTAYHLSVTLSNMACPVACFVAIFLPRTSNRSILSLTTVFAAFTAYVLSTALLSPTPPLVGTVAGNTLLVVSWILVMGLSSYIRLSISAVFRSVGGSALFHCGASSQIGSAVTSVVMFMLINYTGLFKEKEPC